MVSIDLEDLLREWQAAEVPCVDHENTPQGGVTSIVEVGSGVDVFGPDVVRPQLDRYPEIDTWLGGEDAALLVWNPNACPIEDDDEDWSSVGLLVRGGVAGTAELLVPANLSSGDLNIVNTSDVNGKLDEEIAGVDDCKDPGSYPNTVASIREAKRLLLQLASPAAAPPACF